MAVFYKICFAATVLKSLVPASMFGAQIKKFIELMDEIIKTKPLEITGAARTVSVKAH